MAQFRAWPQIRAKPHWAQPATAGRRAAPYEEDSTGKQRDALVLVCVTLIRCVAMARVAGVCSDADTLGNFSSPICVLLDEAEE
jgi:hypothetical protein